MNKTVYLGLSILEPSKTVMYEFWYDYVKPIYIYIYIYIKYAKLCYVSTDNFIVHVKTEDIYEFITKMLKKGFILHIISYKGCY